MFLVHLDLTVRIIMKRELSQYIDDYRLNKYVIKVDVRDGWMLYNTTTGGVVFIHHTDNLHELLGKLVEMYYYVPISLNEVQWVNKLRIEKSSIPKGRAINGFTILTTTDCNARCFYCYEKGQPKVTMTDKTAKDIANYIISVSANTPVNLRWFGGEPLFNHNAINIICNALNEKQVEFKSTMVSNGLLFTDSIIEKAKSLWKLRRVQITLDGTKEVYQKAKLYNGAVGNEFEKVINNIGKLAEAEIRVSIRLNQDFYNTQDLFVLVDYLSNKFRNSKRISVYNHWLYSDNDGTNTSLEKKKHEEYKQLQERIIKCGLFRDHALKNKIRIGHCMADNDASVLITPQGFIGKCEHFTDQHLIGSIYNRDLDYSEILSWKSQYEPTHKCFECPLFPQCIRIKKCPMENDYCNWEQCENKIELIKMALMKKYESYCNSIKKKGNEV